jgi:hypothetical protein
MNAHNAGFASSQVEKFVRETIDAAIIFANNADVRSVRIRFTSDHGANNFAWVVYDRTSVKLNGSENEVDGFWIHSNDFDLMAGSPLSLSETCALEDARSTTDTVASYLANCIGSSARIELFIQSECLGSRREDNMIGNSDEGILRLRFQPELFTD